MKYFYFRWDIYSNRFKHKLVMDWIEYNCVEQYYMHQKALRMWDEERARMILIEKDPRKQKQLWRSISWDITLWDYLKFWYMAMWVLAKFQQNPDLLKVMLEETEWYGEIVEASPYDRIRWIWYNATEAEANIENWWKNHLWIILTSVRKTLSPDL